MSRSRGNVPIEGPSGVMSRSRANGALRAPAPNEESVVEEAFRSIGVQRTLKAGEALIEQGATASAVFFIKSGVIRLLLQQVGKEQTVLAERGEGSFLGELSFLLGHEASASAIAVGTVTCIEVKHERLNTLLHEDPTSAGRFFHVVSAAHAHATAPQSMSSSTRRTERDTHARTRLPPTVPAHPLPPAAPLFHSLAPSDVDRWRHLSPVGSPSCRPS